MHIKTVSIISHHASIHINNVSFLFSCSRISSFFAIVHCDLWEYDSEVSGRCIHTKRKEDTMFKKILVPLDGTTPASKILSYVEDLAKSLNAHVTLLTVVDISEKVHLADADTSIFESVIETFHRAAKKNLVRTAYVLKAKGLEVNWVCQEGFPEEVIIQYAAENSCDLIAMATHTRSKISRMFVSVAEKVLTHATVPVFLTRVA